MPGGAETYTCETCRTAVYVHPDVDECRTAENGGCFLMVQAGWVQVWTRVFTDTPTRAKLVLARGGWICPACAKRYLR